MRGFTSQAPDTRLEVVASDDDPRITQALGEEDYRRAIEILDRHYNLVLVDTGTGILDSAIQGILAEADQLVVVMPPALDGARVAAMTLDWLEEHNYAELVRDAVAVVERQSTARVSSRWSASRSTSPPGAKGVIRIPWDPVLQAGAAHRPERPAASRRATPTSSSLPRWRARSATSARAGNQPLRWVDDEGPRLSAALPRVADGRRGGAGARPRPDHGGAGPRWRPARLERDLRRPAHRRADHRRVAGTGGARPAPDPGQVRSRPPTPLSPTRPATTVAPWPCRSRSSSRTGRRRTSTSATSRWP